jgi:tannase/feruloyl esterase
MTASTYGHAMRRTLQGLITLVAVAAAPATPVARHAPAATCESVKSLALGAGTVTLAETVHAGAFAPPDGTATAAYRSLPTFCRIGATLTPSRDSDIKIEVWLPVANWNGKLQAVGNGAFSGAINYAAMRAALARGYAATSTDTGHTGGGAGWALGHPEKVIDFGWRAVHEMTVAAKRAVAAYYERAPAFSYWNGCSAGGRQGMKAAQRFPADFDGIIAGAPGLDWTARATQAVRVAKVLEASPPARLLAPQRQLLHVKVLEACDAIDGVKDGLLERPDQCAFDPGVLECQGPAVSGCLTKAQVETARLIYSSPTNPRTRRAITGLAPGSELGWTDLGWTASARATGLDQFRFLVFADPSWTIQRFAFETDIVRAEDADRDTINALDPNLKPFFDRGGKLIQYHGWSDSQISPLNSTQYYTRVGDAIGNALTVDASHRLFMAPGMGHCGGGDGPNTFDMVAALEQWVEERRAPDRVIASRSTNGAVAMTRPLCPFPRAAVYKGSGSTNDAENFSCQAR